MNNIDNICEEIQKYFLNCFESVSKNLNIVTDFPNDLVVCSNDNINTQECSVYSYTNFTYDQQKYNIGFKTISINENPGLHAISSALLSRPRYYKVGSINYINYLNEITTIADEIFIGQINAIVANNFSLLKTLSNSKYENRNCESNILITNATKTDSLLNIHTNTPNNKKLIEYTPGNERIIRKLLEIATNDIALVVCPSDQDNDNYIIKGFTNINKAKGVLITILGPHHIKIKESTYEFNVEFEYLDDIFYFKNKDFFSKEDEDIIKKYFSRNRKMFDSVKNFIKDLRTSQNDFHGAIIVFTNDNALNKHFQEHMHAISVDKDNNSLNLPNIYNNNNEEMKNLLIKLCKIDGAIIFNNNGDLNLIGSILDGVSITPGKLERGSRYNSTKTFIEYYSRKHNSKKHLAITMSEDGPVNVFYN